MRGWLRRGVVPAVLTAGCALAVVGTALAAPAPPASAVVLQQSGHWFFDRVLRTALHVHGGTREVDARVALPDEAAQNALMALQGETDGFVVGRDRVWTFDTSTLTATTSAPLPVTDEEPVGIEVPGGPYLVYRERGTVVRLGRPTAVTDAGGPLGPPVRTSDGTVWVHRPDNGALCAFRRDAVDLDCGIKAPGAPPGGLTVSGDVATFVDSRDDAARLVRDGALATDWPLGVNLPEDVLLADQTTRARLPVVVPGYLRLIDVTSQPDGSPAAAPVDVALGAGTFSAPFVSGEIVAVLELGTSTLMTFDTAGAKLSELRLPAGTDASDLRRGEDGRLYVDEDGGGRVHVLQDDGTVATVDLGQAGPSWEAVAGAAPEGQSAPVGPPPPGRLTVPGPDIRALPGAPAGAPLPDGLQTGPGAGVGSGLDGGGPSTGQNSGGASLPGPGVTPQPLNPLPPPQPPAAPSGVAAQLSGTDQATITWQPGNGGGAPTRYTVTSSRGGSVTATTTRATFPDLAAGTSYTFTVTASNDAGTSAASAPSNPLTAIAPAAEPGSFVATRSGCTPGCFPMTAELRWTAPDLRGGTLVHYMVAGTQAGRVIPTRTVTGTSTQYSGPDEFDPCAKVTFEVRAVTKAPGGGDPVEGTPATHSFQHADCTPDIVIRSAEADAPDTVTVIFEAASFGPSTCSLRFNSSTLWSGTCGDGEQEVTVDDLEADTTYEVIATITYEPRGSQSTSKTSDEVNVTTPTA